MASAGIAIGFAVISVVWASIVTVRWLLEAANSIEGFGLRHSQLVRVAGTICAAGVIAYDLWFAAADPPVQSVMHHVRVLVVLYASPRGRPRVLRDRLMND